MARGITEREIGKMLGVTQAYVNGLAKRLPLQRHPEGGFNHIDLLYWLSVSELMKADLSGPEACDIIAQCRDEIAHLFDRDENRVWVLIGRSDENEAVFVTVRAWEAALDAMGTLPAVRIVSLHSVMMRAINRAMTMNKAPEHA